ncbi:unnamed protein product [Eretmochelys imbricata]
MDSTMFPFFEGSAISSDAQRPRGRTGCLSIPQHHFLAPGCPAGGCHVHSESHAARPSGLPASQRKTAHADSPISHCRGVLSQRWSCQALDQPSCSPGRVHPRSPQEGFAGSTMAQPVPVLLWAWCALTALAGAVRGSFDVSVLPEAPMVAYGGAVWINCSTTCQDPDVRGSLETSLTKTDEKIGPGWVAFLLKNITEWASAPQCYFSCRGRVKVVFANISAYRAPERVGLERLPELELGRAYNLTCRVLNVAPVRHLTVTLRQGGRTLHTETFQNRTRAGPDDVTVTKEITPRRRDHGQEVTCHTALDLTPHEPHLENSSSAVELKVYALPEEPQLQISHHIEVGDKATARCDVTKVFPAAGEARFTLSFGGQRLNFTVTTSNDTATAQGEVRSLSAGERQLTCTVSVGPVSRSAGQSVLVYSLPEPILEITESQTHVNSSVTVTCRSPKAHPPDVLLQLRDAKRVLVRSAPAQPLVDFPLTAGEEDNGREFTCEARLASANQTVKRTSARLTVVYGPRMDDSGCPREWTWKEGTEQTFSCQAQGNPEPAVECKKDGVPFSIGVQQQVRREDAGTYHCEAFNSYGYASRDVTVHVEWAARGSFEVSVSPAAPVVAYGESVWINCSTTCPDPDARGSLETSLTKTDHKSGPGWVAFLLKNITEWMSAFQCQFSCRGRVKVVFANISAYRAPERVGLERLPELELGRAYNLTCRVLSVAPVRHLTVTLRQGGRTLHTETFQNRTRAAADDVTVTQEITPRRWDHGQQATCHAALDLRPRGPLLQSSSSAVELQEAGEFRLTLGRGDQPGAGSSSRTFNGMGVPPAAGSGETRTQAPASSRELGGGRPGSCAAPRRAPSSARDEAPAPPIPSPARRVLSHAAPAAPAPGSRALPAPAAAPGAPRYVPGSGPGAMPAGRGCERRAAGRGRDRPTCGVPATASSPHPAARAWPAGGPEREPVRPPGRIGGAGSASPARLCGRWWVPVVRGGGVWEPGLLGSLPSSGREVGATGPFAISGAAEEPFNVSVRPEDSVVEHGGAIWLNCSTTCQDPGARGGLETSLTKAQEKRGPRWEARELVNIWEWVSAPQCYFFCYGKVTRASAHITTYRAPERVGLERIPELERGRAYNLTCRVLNVAPVRHLTVTLRQGGRTLHTETFQNRTRAAADNVTVTHEIIPQRQDHGQEVTCHSALDLRPLGQLFQNSSPAVELRVFALPEEPQLQISHHIEVGDKATARCDVTKVFPAAGEARFTLSFGGQHLNFTVTTSNDTATAQGEVRSLSAGERQLTCTVSVGPVSRSAGQSVLVYSFPQPVLEIDQPRALVNRNVSLTCCSPPSQPPGTTLQLRDSERTLASGHQPCLQLTLTARKGDNGRQFTCEGNLALGSHSFVKNTSAQLIVLYKPTLDESGCPSHQTWLEGTQQQLACEADGNPTPEVSCRKGSQVYNAGSVQNVTRGHAGVYRCSATNVHGTASRNMTIHVECKGRDRSLWRPWGADGPTQLGSPVSGARGFQCLARSDAVPANARRVRRRGSATWLRTGNGTRGLSPTRGSVSNLAPDKPSMDELSCPSAWTWVKGMPQAFSCDADGIPAPEVVCTKDGVSYRLGQGLGLKDPMGTYQCNATNPHGSATKTVTITLEYKPTMDESSCPSTRAWLEGTLHTLACEADGIPVPRVPCAKEGAADEFSGERNVSRNDSGTYWCTAINRHGSARRAVTVRVEYRPVVLLLAVSPSATVPRGANFNISCRAEGSPAPAYRWTVPPAPNVHCSADNSTVSVAGADRHNRGVYVCRVSNAHGQHLGRLQIQVTDNRLIVAALTVGVAVLLLGGAAGFVYYLKSTACKKGEYNVQDAESSSEATCLGRDSAVYGIQLTQT